MQGGDELQSAIAEAVHQGVQELDRLEALSESVMSQFATVSARTSRGEGDPIDLLTRCADLETNLRSELREHLVEQRKVLASFNIAFFGRTGAGKSTLLSAFGELDGSYVSPGDSDWTTAVETIDWRGCKLFDTPGINGWGRTKSRVELEETARRAVEISDVVLLCFDTQSQQASEFSKVARWVRDYGKPVIAVLNVKNLRWRHPAKVPDQAARRNINMHVPQHADNIRTELANIGLHDTPVVAMQSRRALFARASTPFKGPALEDFLYDREHFGVDYLARWSNFGPLEALLTSCVTEGGSGLRLTSLREGFRSIFSRFSSALRDLIEHINERVDALDASIEEMFGVLGYLEGDQRPRFVWDEVWSGDLIAIAETARGRPYTSSPVGRHDRHVEHLLRSHFSDPRSQSLLKFEDLMFKAFADHEDVDDERFLNEVFSDEQLQSTADSVWAAQDKFLVREIGLAVAAAAPDLSTVERESGRIEGGTGETWRYTATTLQAGGLLAGGAAGAISLPGVANFWNPGGWVLIATSIGLGVAAQVQKLVGDHLGKLAEVQASLARSRAIRSGRAAIHQTYDRVEKLVANQTHSHAWELASPSVRALLREAAELRTAARHIGDLAQSIEDEAATIPRARSASAVLQEAQERVLALANSELGALPADHIWLGQDWLEPGSLDDAITCRAPIKTACSPQSAHPTSRTSRLLC